MVLSQPVVSTTHRSDSRYSNLHQAQIGEVAVQPRGRALAGFLNRMHRKFEGNSAGIANALAHARRQDQMMPIARRKIRAGLGDADDGSARTAVPRVSARNSSSAPDTALSCPALSGSSNHALERRRRGEEAEFMLNVRSQGRIANQIGRLCSHIYSDKLP